MIVATRSVVDALTRGALIRVAFLQIKMAGRRLGVVAARNLAMTGAVAFLEPERHLLVPCLSVCAACRNRKREMFVPKSQISVRLEERARPGGVWES